ncbi:hypothetical protein [Actinomadura sp. 21ATH]|uniref:hypothetical protein n=1 Tax=Actinomadura sp. 21ATH TaxID=1735444 RepID=UPI0035BEE0FB
MPWWKRKPRMPADTDPDLAQFRQELITQIGAQAASRVRLSPRDSPTQFRPVWDPMPSDEAVSYIGTLITSRNPVIAPTDLEAQPNSSGWWVVLLRPGAGRLNL